MHLGSKPFLILILSLSQDVLETWMLLEYCDRGSLARAIERGKLQSRAPGGGPDLVRSGFRACASSGLAADFCFTQASPSCCM